MNIFCDTNIILEYLQQRKYAEEVEQILTIAIEKEYNLFVSVGSFYTITYLTEKYLKEEKSLSEEARVKRLRYILNGVLDMFKLAMHTSVCIKDGVNDEVFSDLEDSYQAHVAEEVGCDVILTINAKHFEGAKMDVFTPVQFLARINE